MLTGNIFDWGAQEVAILMETTTFCFEDAQKKIPGTRLFQTLFLAAPFRFLVKILFERSQTGRGCKTAWTTGLKDCKKIHHIDVPLYLLTIAAWI